MKKNLRIIRDFQKELTLLEQISSLLDWDHQTNMPAGGVSSRAEQTALVSFLYHDSLTSGKLRKALKALKKEKLSGIDKYSIRKLDKMCRRACKLPSEFVEEMARTTALAHSAWEKAKSENDFAAFKPHLEKIVKLKRKEAGYVNLPGHPYNSLLDSFEEGMTVKKLKTAFDSLKGNLTELIGKVKSSQVYRNKKQRISGIKFPREQQVVLCGDAAGRIGLRESESRLDFAEHPFTTTIGLHDIRITTNVRRNPFFAFESTIHEAGHAVYELGFPEKYNNTVLSDAPSMGLHESQSRFYENMIGKSKPFWKYYGPKFNRAFGAKLKTDEWYAEFNRITPGRIRVEADELHYCLHIILRFELETGLLEGAIDTAELPELWNKKMKDFFGVAPRNDSEGVLQDVHWAGGHFGYFPSYAIGTLYAAQLYQQALSEIPRLEIDIAGGRFDEIRNWLRKKVHVHGSKFLAEEVISKTCGEGLNPNAFIEYVTDKYSYLYKL